MNKRILTITSCALGFVITSSVHAQLPVSLTSASLPVSITAGQTQPVSLPFTRQPVDRGTVSVAGGTLTLTGLSVNLTTLTGTHSVRGISSSSEGAAFTISSFPAASQLTASSNTFAVGDIVEVVPNWTLNALFPSGGDLTIGGNPGAADKIYVKVGSLLSGFFYDTDVSQWRSVNTTDTADKGGSVIGFNDGILVVPNATKNIVLAGVARTGDVSASYSTGSNVVSLGYPEASSLDASGLKDTLNNGANPGSADKVYLKVGSALAGFFYDTDVNQWRSVNTADTANKGSTAIPAGSALLIVGNAAGAVDQVQPF